MTIEDSSSQTERNPRGERGDQTREKLVLAAIDVFGRYGFDATTTRILARAAGVNQQAIPYYFGGKEGLYLAVADHIAGQIGSRIHDLRQALQLRFKQTADAGEVMGRDEARSMLTAILQRMAAIFLNKETEAWARFMIREQMEPTEAFQRIYGCVMQPMLGLAGRLVGIMTGEDADSESVRLRTISLIGNVLVLRVAHATVQSHLGWQEVGERELAAVQALVAELVGNIGMKAGES